MKCNRDLLIVGCGALGCIVGEEWKGMYPDAEIVAETATTGRHEELKKLGFTPRVADPDSEDQNNRKFNFVVMCVPPSKNENYEDIIRRALMLFTTTEQGEGGMVYVSSSGVYKECDGVIIKDSDKDEEVFGDSEHSLKMQKYEAALKEDVRANGRRNVNILRAAGLYNLEKGPHRVYLRMTSSPRRADGYINLLHYEDAAGLCLAMLTLAEKKGSYEEIKCFVGCDGNPVTRASMMDDVYERMDVFEKLESNIASSKEKPMKFGVDSPMDKQSGHHMRFSTFTSLRGKILDNSASRKELDWQPKYKSFKAFLESL
eukprot:Nk52_evm20s310 gene=Nk52_evmTU20s310